MADRGTLHINDLVLFDTFMLSRGYQKVPTKGIYEERRYKRLGEAPVILFKKNSAKEHVTIQDKDYGIVKDFFHTKTTTRGN